MKRDTESEAGQLEGLRIAAWEEDDLEEQAWHEPGESDRAGEDPDENMLQERRVERVRTHQGRPLDHDFGDLCVGIEVDAQFAIVARQQREIDPVLERIDDAECMEPGPRRFAPVPVIQLCAGQRAERCDVETKAPLWQLAIE